MMSIYTWSLPWISHNYALLYQLPNSNLFTHRMLCLWEMPLENSTPPGSIHLYIHKRYHYLAVIYYLLFYFALYYYLQLSTRLTCLQITRSRGLTTLLPALGASHLFICVQPLKTVEDWYSYWFDKPWFLNWGKYLPVLCCNYPFLFTANPTRITSIRKDCWRRCRGISSSTTK